MALERHAYQDPLEYLIHKESKTCKGCEMNRNMTLLGRLYELCTLGRKFGKRCKFYKAKK